VFLPATDRYVTNHEIRWKLSKGYTAQVSVALRQVNKGCTNDDYELERTVAQHIVVNDVTIRSTTSQNDSSGTFALPSLGLSS
jgi:hypothetical protein